MPVEVIDLLSSDGDISLPSLLDFEPGPILTHNSTAKAQTQPSQSAARRQHDLVDLSDDLEILTECKNDTYVPVEGDCKRRRLSPPRLPLAELPQAVSKHAAEDVPPMKPKTADFDPIFSSSPNGLPLRYGSALHHVPPKDIVDLIESDLAPSSPLSPTVSTVQFSSRTAALLAEIDKARLVGRLSKPGTRNLGSKAAPTAAAAAPLSSIEEFSSQPAGPTQRKTRLAGPVREQRTREKEAAKAQKAADRAAEKAAKQREKQLAADLAEVNRARHDKKVSVGEMIVQMPEAFFERDIGRLSENVLKQLGVAVEFAPMEASSSIFLGDVLTWKRQVRARFDEEMGHWVPLNQLEVHDEPGFVLCMLEAEKFVQAVQKTAFSIGGSAHVRDLRNETAVGEPGGGLDEQIRLLKTKWPSRRPILLIEGLETLLRKSKNSRNRNYRAAVQAQADADTAPASSQASNAAPRRRKKQTEALSIDEDAVEETLLEIQVEHNCLIYHTAAAPETAEWVGKFTEHVSTIPYKKQQSTAEASFCMDAGQVRTGDDKDDTYIKMLQEIVRITLPVAYGIAAQYPTLLSLVHAFRDHGPLVLEDLKKCSNRNGAFTDARIGPALSKKVYKLFTGLDPDRMDG